MIAYDRSGLLREVFEAKVEAAVNVVVVDQRHLACQTGGGAKLHFAENEGCAISGIASEREHFGWKWDMSQGNLTPAPPFTSTALFPLPRFCCLGSVVCQAGAFAIDGLHVKPQA